MHVKMKCVGTTLCLFCFFPNREMVNHSLILLHILRLFTRYFARALCENVTNKKSTFGRSLNLRLKVQKYSRNSFLFFFSLHKSDAHTTATKLNRANVMLYTVKGFVNANILKSIYYVLFESNINYACIV